VLFWPEKVDSYVAAASEKRELTLEDGTSVLMAPGSLLEIVFNEKIREVRLIKGAAIFDIAPEDRAFLTKAGDYEIRDIGTIFSVEVRSEIAGEELEIAGVEVEVKEGAVEIVNTAVNASQAARVEEGETTVWREPEVTPEVEPFSVERFAEWQNGFLSYRNRSLAEVLADLGRTYGLEIRMEDQTLSEETITGTMPVDDLVDAIGLLETLLPVELRQEGSSLYRVVRVD
ncbi:MAG: FecR domain-containing protein, partial [Verrucomicrobiota bacterium]